MSKDFSRREALVNISKAIVLTTAGTGVLPPALAQHVHEAIAETKSLDTNGNYQPKYLTGHEYKTLRVLSDIIVPADEHSKGALDGGAPEFIDFLCSRNSDLAEIFTGGLAWIDDEMRRRFQTPFVDAKPEQRMTLLDVIAYRKNETPATAPGSRFFMGNEVLSHFSVPQEAVDYAIRRSPFANQA
jgi:gluconate 2-dehydrogenase gamma chain